jgi:hypothetical protein
MRRDFFLVIAALPVLTTWTTAKDQPKFKSLEVKHFPNAEGVELPPEFSDYLYAELRATLQKKKLAEQLVGEDEVVDSADAPHSATLEGSVLEYKKGSLVKESLIGFGAGGRSLTAHIRLTRRSNHEVIIEKDLKVRAMARWDPKTLAKFLASSIAGELKHSD